MAETWLPFCTPELGPPAKRGYNGVPTRSLADIEGEVKHSMEGTVAGAVGRLMTPLTSDPYTQASWHFSVPKVGKPRQHYALEAICWHAGGPGDRRFDTSLVGNLTLVGIEHEDYPDNKLNANQLHWTIEISRFIREHCPRVAARPPALRVNLWEHRMLSATSCPSGLIPWATIIAALEEDDMGMTPAEAAEFAALKTKVAALIAEDLTDDAQELAFKKRLNFLANVAQLDGKIGEGRAYAAALLARGPLASRLEGLALAEKALNEALKMITEPASGMRAELHRGEY